MTFWVYENWTHKYSKFHKASCSYCNHGKGFHPGSANDNGQWHGPFESAASAEQMAQRVAAGHPNRDAWTVGACKACAPG